jgi:hypothetical protein
MYKKRKSKMFADGGIMQEGGTVDEVSGNDVPPGSLKEEVRDDVDAKLSVGEYVFPADVTRYYGIAKLEAMRKEAQDSLKQMEAGGRMGNAEQVSEEAIDSYDDDEEFSKSVDAAMSEQDGENEYNKGGVVKKYAPGGSVGYDPAINKEIYKRAPIKGFEMIPMEDDKGNRIFIPFINGEPQLAIPAGYSIRAAATEAPPTTGTTPTAPAAQPEGGDKSDNSEGDRGLGYSPTSGLTSPGPVSFQGNIQNALDVYGSSLFGLLPGAKIASLAADSMLNSATVAESKKQQSIISDNISTFGPSYGGANYGTEVDDGGFGVTSMTGAGIAANPMGIDPATAQGQRSIIAETINLSISKNISPNDALDTVMEANREAFQRSEKASYDLAAPNFNSAVSSPVSLSSVEPTSTFKGEKSNPSLPSAQDLNTDVSSINTDTRNITGTPNTGTFGGIPANAGSIDVGNNVGGGGYGNDGGGYDGGDPGGVGAR